MISKPPERAPLLLVFGELAGRMARLIRARPALVARMVVAPREAIHATGAYLHLAPAADRPDEEVARTLDGADSRTLLHAALPGCSPRLFRALDRVGDRVQSRHFYQQLGELARGLFGDVLLRSDRRLDHARLNYYAALTRMDPAICSLRSVLPESTFDAAALDALLAFLRARHALRDDDLELPPKAGMTAIVRRLQAVLARLPAQNPGFAPPPGFRFLRSSGELQATGRAFQNCVALPQHHAAQHHIRLINGRGVFLVSDAPPLLVSLRRIDETLWVLDQVCGPKNAFAPPEVREKLLRDFEAAGLRILATDPASALSHLTASMRGARRFFAPQAADDGEDLRDAEALA